MTGRIIDADVDALANINRLTAQVETLKWERDMAVEGQRIAREQVQRLQESLTAAEQARDENAARAEYFMVDRDNCEVRRVELRDRVRALETALRRGVSALNHLPPDHGPIRKLAGEAVEEMRAALNPAPLTAAELVAKYGFKPLTDVEREINLQNVGVRTVDAPPAETPAPVKWEADHMGLCDHAATTTKLGRAVAAMQACAREIAYECPSHHMTGFDGGCDACVAKNEGNDMLAPLLPILADADGTQAAEVWRELETVYEACMGISFRDSLPRLHEALAAVDARRGTVKP